MLIRRKSHIATPTNTEPCSSVGGQKGFTEDELYELWLRFKDNDDSLRILADFMMSDKTAAKKNGREI